MSVLSAQWPDMPHGVDVNTGAVIPPPPGAFFAGGYQSRTSNGTPYPQFATQQLSSGASTPARPTFPMHPSGYPLWPGMGTPAPAPAPAPPALVPAHVPPTPVESFGLPSPASFGPSTPMSSSGYIHPTPLSYTPSLVGGPITAATTPYFNHGRATLLGLGGGGGGGSVLGLTASPSLDKYGYPLSRTPSNGRKKRRSMRGGGGGGGVGGGGGPNGTQGRNDYQLWNGPEVYSLKNLARRPRDWRPDYNPRSGIASYITLGKHRSDVPDYTDPTKRSLNGLLLFKPGEEAMYWNLRYPPSNQYVEFMKLNNRRYNDIDMVQLATSPPAEQMRLYHPRLPWYIDVFGTQPNGVTIQDILETIYKQLSTQIHQRHYYNEELDDAHRGVLSAAFSERCDYRREVTERGILQVDFLADKYVLMGLVKGKNGMWEMKTGGGD